jgi:hypothetical protein
MITITDNMSDEEKKATFYKANIKAGLSDCNAKEKAEKDFEQYQKIMALVDNPTDNISVIKVDKGGKIIQKTGRFSNIQSIKDIK